MGLDTSHDCWHGAYSSFMRWRNAVANAAEYPPLNLMEGFCTISGSFSIEEYEEYSEQISVAARYGDNPMGHAHKIITEWYLSGAKLPISWKPFENDPLSILLHHSDCEGRIKHCDCLPIAKRLKEILPNIPEVEGIGYIICWRDKTQQFIDGLMLAHKRGEDVLFH